MKKMWKMKKDAVSPVIATILMVAITVVLAAVLYVMVMGFGGTGETTPTGAFTMTQKEGTDEKVQFGVITPDVDFDELKIVLNGTTSYAWDGNSFGVIDVVDLAADGKVGSGDYLLIPITVAGDYTVTMVYVPTGDAIDSIDFTF